MFTISLWQAGVFRETMSADITTEGGQHQWQNPMHFCGK
jgi:hypothetical protein